MLTMLALLACSPDTPIIHQPDETGEAETGGDGGEGDPSDEVYTPSHFTIYGSFGIDAEAGTLSTFVVDGVTVEPWVALRIVDDPIETECWVFFTPPSPAEVPLERWEWVDSTTGETMVHTAFTLPEDSRVHADEGCADWDEETFGPVESVWPHGWGIGIGNLRQDVAGEVDSPKGDPWLAERLEADELLGASWSSDIFGAEPRWASHTALAARSEGGELTLDEKGRPQDLMTGTEVLQAGHPIPTGVYILQPIKFWSFETWFSAD